MLRFYRYVAVLFAVYFSILSSVAMGSLLSPGAVSPSTSGDPVAIIQIDTTPVSLPIGGGKIMTTSYSAASPPLSLYGLGNRDPYITYHLEFSNTTGADAFFEFAFGIPITPSGNNSALLADLEVKLTDGGNGVVSISPTYDGINSSTGIQRALLSTNAGATFFTADEFGPLGPSITTAGTSDYHFSQPYSVLPPSKTFDYMELLVGFNLSSGDSVTLNGDIAIQVPEPSSLGIVLSSSIGLAFCGTRLLRVKYSFSAN